MAGTPLTGNPYFDIPMAGLSIYDMLTGDSAIKDLEQKQGKAIDIGTNIMGQDYASKEPAREQWMTLIGQMAPVYQDIFKWMYGYSHPGATSYTSPTFANPAVPEWLKGALSAPAGSVRNKIANFVMAYGGNSPESQYIYNDILHDVDNGENIDSRLSRAFGTSQLPSGWTAPSLTTGGETVPLTTGGTKLSNKSIFGGTERLFNPSTRNLPDTAPAGAEAPKSILPDFLQLPAVRDWKQGLPPEVMTAMSDLDNLDIAQMMKGTTNDWNSSMARRGLSGSSLDQTKQIVEFPLWAQKAKADAHVNREMTNLGYMDKLYAEQINRALTGQNMFNSLLGTITGQQAQLQPMMDLTPYANFYTNSTNYWGSQIPSVGNQMAQTAGSAVQSPGYRSGYNQQPQGQQQTGGSSMGQTIGDLGDFVDMMNQFNPNFRYTPRGI